MRRLLVLAFLLLLAVPTGAQAHGGGELVVAAEPAGPYSVSVWVNPPEPVAGEPVHFTVGVGSPGDRAPVLDATVQISMLPAGGTMAFSGAATTEESVNKLFYETDLTVPETGMYEVTVEVAGDAGGGSVVFDVQVGEGGGVNWLLWGLVGLGVIILLGAWRTRQAVRADSTMTTERI